MSGLVTYFEQEFRTKQGYRVFYILPFTSNVIPGNRETKMGHAMHGMDKIELRLQTWVSTNFNVKIDPRIRFTLSLHWFLCHCTFFCHVFAQKSCTRFLFGFCSFPQNAGLAKGDYSYGRFHKNLFPSLPTSIFLHSAATQRNNNSNNNNNNDADYYYYSLVFPWIKTEIITTYLCR